tara:strand:+ start:4316 stop:4924 length:609 start_codon:yes stop_codon:yes gene_type:complete
MKTFSFDDWDALCEGREETWRLFVSRFGPRLFRYARTMLSHEADALDVVNETFQGVWISRTAFRKECSVDTWVFQICRKKIQHKRRTFSRITSFLSAYSLEEIFYTENPEDSLLLQSELEWMRRAVRSLPLKYREVLILRYVEEYSIKQTAGILGIKEHIVKNRAATGRKMLKQKYQSIEGVDASSPYALSTQAEQEEEVVS